MNLPPCASPARQLASLGSATIVSLYLQEKYVILADTDGHRICGGPAGAACGAASAVDYSILGEVLTRLILWVNHKPGRYSVT